MKNAVLAKKRKADSRSEALLKGIKVRKILPLLRWLVQGVYTAFYVFVGFEFYYFYLGIRGGNLTVYRPPAVEGFLPISSLLGLGYFFATGNYDHVHPAGLTIIMAVILSAVLTRKSFCGWVCPVGCLSRMLEKGSQRLFKIKVTVPPLLDHILMSVKYLLCGFFIYAVFFKMSINDIESFIASPYNIAADAKMLMFFIHMSKMTLVVLLSLVATSILVKNFWCRYLCPYGALLGVISFFSPFAVKRDSGLCIDCEACSKECPYQISVHRRTSVKTVECTGCLSCVSVCPVDDCLTTSYFRKRRVKELTIPILLLSLILSFYLVARVTDNWESKVEKGVFERYYSIAERLDHPR